MKILYLALLNTLFLASGQVLWKIGMSNKEISNLSQLFQAIFSPFVFLGLFIYAVSTVLWLYIINKGEISYVYPIQSLVFVIVMVAGLFIFRENISLNRWIGLTLICFGVYVVSLK